MNNREFKFRMWDGSKNRYSDFFGMSFYNRTLHDVLGVKYEPTTKTCAVLENKEDRCIIQQFTGLKDRNGIDVYEGDILLYSLSYEEMMMGEGENELTYVVFKDGAFYLSNNIPIHELIDTNGRLSEEVIGNICEDDDLFNACEVHERL
jgi:uncharacterized phage protein (TIGR01671 family)